MRVYVGTYTRRGGEGIYVCHLDPASGAMEVLSAAGATDNPSYLTLHPNGRALYAVNEVPERGGQPGGGVSAYAIDAETATTLVKERGRLKGGNPLDAKSLKALGKYKSFEALGKALAEGDTTWSKLDDTVRVFRLHPPRKGYEGIKRSYKVGGALGDRGEDINVLLQRMM